MPRSQGQVPRPPAAASDNEPSDEVTLNGVKERDFSNWRHHPVTKIVLRFLLDYERQLAEKQIARNRNCSKAADLDPFLMGEFKGQINLAREVRELKFVDIAAFYSDPDHHEEET